MSEKTTTEMQEELEANRYRFNRFSDGIFVVLQVFAPDFNWQLRKSLDGFENEEKPSQLVLEAYQHYQREKEYQAMRGLLEELASNQWDAKTRNGYPETNRAANDLDHLRHKAKVLLESMKTGVK